MTARTTTATFTGVSWEEKEVSGSAPGPRLARASVVNDYAGGIEAKGTSCEYTLTYVNGTVGVFSGMERLTGAVDGREGSFVVRQSGTFDEEGVVRCTVEVVPGSPVPWPGWRVRGSTRPARGSGRCRCPSPTGCDPPPRCPAAAARRGWVPCWCPSRWGRPSRRSPAPPAS